jgi:multiple sugar transport system substrate-binding protein
LFFGCQRAETVELTFAFGPDDSGTVAALVEDFNRAHEGEIHVTWQESSRFSNEFYRQIEKDFSAEQPSMDVIASDVVWTAAMASSGWAEELSGRFYEDFVNDDFVTSALNSASYQSKIWGIPWYTDAGILFYRKDLLAANGFTAPPRTWEELRRMAQTVMENEGIDYGYVFQGANYEGGVVNACEFIWNAGGNILISDLSVGSDIDAAEAAINIITINSDAAKRGLGEAYEMIRSGVSPSAVSYFKELETVTAFANGEAVFMRNWPTAYPRMQEGEANIRPEQIGFAPLPTSEAGMPSYSCLGGWNLVINKRISSEKQDAAWTFIRYLTDPVQQQRMAISGGSLPTIRSLYQDASFLAAVPMMTMAKEVIERTRVRPVTPRYMELSPDLAWSFNEVLKGDLNPTEAVETIEGQMEGVLVAVEH